MTEDSALIKEIIAGELPGFAVESAAFEGEGDFCRAYTINDAWIFRFAYNVEGSCTVERELHLLPAIALAVPVTIPNPTYAGHDPSTGFAFMGYRKIEGVELTRALMKMCSPREEDAVVATLAGFLQRLHGFDPDAARRIGVPVTDYPLARTEEGILPGSAANIYHEQTAKLTSYSALSEELRTRLTNLSQALIESALHPVLPAVLVHGDLSSDHILLDPQKKEVKGIIDFSDAIITTPLLDYMYLYHAYGSAFLDDLLGLLHANDAPTITREVRLLHAWYLAVRLLWALEHNYVQGIEPRLKALQTTMGNSRFR